MDMSNVIYYAVQSGYLTHCVILNTRLVCHDWKNAVNILWKNYYRYAKKRAAIYETKVEEIFYFDQDYYIADTKKKIKLERIYSDTLKGFGKATNLKYKIKYSNREECNQLKYRGKKYYHDVVYGFGNIGWHFSKRINEGDVVIIHTYKNKECRNILLTKYQGHIQRYNKNTIFSIEEYNINYFAPLVRYLPNGAAPVHRTVGQQQYIIDYREIFIATREEYEIEKALLLLQEKYPQANFYYVFNNR
jgi:hypothetical protein